MSDAPFTQSDHDEAVEDFGRVLLLFGGIVIGITLIILLG